MSKNRFNIIEVAPSKPSLLTKKNQYREEAQAQFDHLWQIDPEQFNPLRNSMETERIHRTQLLMDEYFIPSKMHIADLGCGKGIFSRRLAELGAFVKAVDISSIPLRDLQNLPNITTSQDYIPKTMLSDDSLDVIICTDVIAYLPSDQYRLFFSELSRLIHAKGYVICSTPIDINSEDALQRFASLAETEFSIGKWVFSYHACYIRLQHLLAAPTRFAQAGRDKKYREKKLNERSGLSRWWFKINSMAIPATIWRGISILMQPFCKFFERNRQILLVLEKFCRFFWNEGGISHAIFIGMRRPLFEPVVENKFQERKGKREVWE